LLKIAAICRAVITKYPDGAVKIGGTQVKLDARLLGEVERGIGRNTELQLHPDCRAPSEAQARNLAPPDDKQDGGHREPDLSECGNLAGQAPNTIVVRPFEVAQSYPCTRLKPRTTFQC